jgi:hypothetical protein
MRRNLAICGSILVSLLAQPAFSARPEDPAQDLPAVHFADILDLAPAPPAVPTAAPVAPAAAEVVAVSSGDTVSLPSLPVMGKWLLDSNDNVAHWLGDKLRGLRLDEPINVVIRAAAPKAPPAAPMSGAAALDRLLAATKTAGYPLREGHSCGYQAIIAGQRYGDISQGKDKCTFSNEAWVLPNNHGRIFGPALWEGNYYFIAAFSREDIVLPATHHKYVSFKAARDDFAKRMQQSGAAALVGSVPMGNGIPDDGFQTTGDHDGDAVLLDLK